MPRALSQLDLLQISNDPDDLALFTPRKQGEKGSDQQQGHCNEEQHGEQGPLPSLWIYRVGLGSFHTACKRKNKLYLGQASAATEVGGCKVGEQSRAPVRPRQSNLAG